jgi:hypothetical protein
MERIDKKDPKVQFRELTQPRYTCTPEAYVTKFQWMKIMVTDVFEQRPVMIFTKGLDEPLRCWVKAFRTNTLHEAIMKTQDMTDIVPKKTSKKTLIPQKGQVSKHP